MWRYLLPLGVLVALVGVFWHGLHTDSSRVPSPFIGKNMPAISLSELRHPDVTFGNQQLRGHIALVNFWGTWCISCREEHPVLMQFAARHSVPIYGIDYKDKRASAKDWLNKKGNPYATIAFDPESKTAINWGVYGAPETFLVDAHGVIRHKYIGPLTSELVKNDLVPRIARLRAEQ
jgi:cytochrome c biogenesis protein CcmG/thiol:disulfide interchange protein DsbE